MERNITTNLVLMLCNFCHEEIPVGKELKEQVGYSYLTGSGGERLHVEGGYFHKDCLRKKQMRVLEIERALLWKGMFWLWAFMPPVLIIILISKYNRMKKLDKMIKILEEENKETKIKEVN